LCGNRFVTNRLISIGTKVSTRSSSSDDESPKTSDDSHVGDLLRNIEERLAAAWVAGDRSFIEQVLADNWSVIDSLCCAFSFA